MEVKVTAEDRDAFCDLIDTLQHYCLSHGDFEMLDNISKLKIIVEEE